MYIPITLILCESSFSSRRPDPGDINATNNGNAQKKYLPLRNTSILNTSQLMMMLVKCYLCLLCILCLKRYKQNCNISYCHKKHAKSEIGSCIQNAANLSNFKPTSNLRLKLSALANFDHKTKIQCFSSQKKRYH